MAHNVITLADPTGTRVYPGQRHTKQYGWENAGSITAVVAVGQAPIDVDKRADADIVALVAAKKVIYEPADGQMAFEFRVRADGHAADDLVLPFYAAAGVDHYMPIGILTCTQGTQDGDSTEHFIDAISQAALTYPWLTWTRVVAAQANGVARFVINTHGYDRFLWVCTDLQNANNVYIDCRRTA